MCVLTHVHTEAGGGRLLCFSPSVTLYSIVWRRSFIESGHFVLARLSGHFMSTTHEMEEPKTPKQINKKEKLFPTSI